MVGRIHNPPVRLGLTQRERSQRHSVDLEASVAFGEDEESVRVQDVSATGAALLGDAPELTNEQFLDLHIEGFDRLQGKVVRRFTGGYALQFDGETGPAISEEELAEFRKRASISG